MIKKGKKCCFKLMAAVLTAAMLMTGCGKTVSYDISDYVLETEYKDDFRVLQLTDIHMANKDNRDREYDFLKLTIDSADADMIVVTGDIFTFADKTVARELFDFLDSFGIPWCLTWGNHDEQCYYSIDWMTGVLNEYGSDCMFIDHQDDDIRGNSNYAVNLTDGDEIVYQIIMMDSNRYNYGEYWGYDYIRDDQIKWYEDLCDYTTEKNGGKTVDSLLCFHIPLPEFREAWDSVQEGGTSEVSLEYGEEREDVCDPDFNSGFYDVIKDRASTRAILTGHDHVNNSIVDYDGIYLCYGIKATDRIYYDDDMLGGRVITLGRDGTLGFENIYHTYEEVE